MIGFITGQSYLRKYITVMGVLTGNALYKERDLLEETTEHLIFECECLNRKRIEIHESLTKGGQLVKTTFS